jgi:hypothetical protein
VATPTRLRDQALVREEAASQKDRQDLGHPGHLGRHAEGAEEAEAEDARHEEPGHPVRRLLGCVQGEPERHREEERSHSPAQDHLPPVAEAREGRGGQHLHGQHQEDEGRGEPDLRGVGAELLGHQHHRRADAHHPGDAVRGREEETRAEGTEALPVPFTRAGRVDAASRSAHAPLSLPDPLAESPARSIGVG